MQVNIDNHFKREERIVHEQFGMVVVFDGFGKCIGRYNALDLGVAWFTMDNDAFIKTYGFSWTPKGALYEEAKRKVGNL